MDSCIVQSGKFTATGSRVNIPIRSDVDWMYVYNYNVLKANGADTGAQFYWQRGMDSDKGVIYTKTAVTNALAISEMASNGFSLLDQGNQAYISSQITTFSAFSNSATPQVTVAATTNLRTGDVVIFSQTASERNASNATAYCGIPFQITVDDGTHFTITNALQAPQPLLNAAGSVRKVNLSSIFYPQFRYIVKVDTTNATEPVITTSVDHGYQVGQLVYFTVPSSVNGMVQLNTLTGSIKAVTASTFTVDVDTNGFTAFNFPLTGTGAGSAVDNFPYTNATVSPAGMNTAIALAQNPAVNILSDATTNISIIGMSLASGASSPAGIAGDVIYYVAGKSSLLLNGPLFQ